MAEECVYQVVLKYDGNVFFTGLLRNPLHRSTHRSMPEIQTKVENVVAGYHNEDTDVEVSLATADESTEVHETLDALLKAIRTASENQFSCDLDA